MQSKEKDNLIFIRLFPGEDITKELREVCREYKVETAVVLSGLGQLAEFELGFFKEKGNYVPEKFGQPHELLSLTGNVSLSPHQMRTDSVKSSAKGALSSLWCGDKQDNEYEFHLHASLSNEQKGVVGGHFIKGRVSVTAEIVLLKTDLKIKRRLEESTGLRGLFLED